MFEEICLVCGKHLSDYGSAYCSDDCQGRDATSPSISSSSSALSSPHLGYANGADVPPLIPSALGSALRSIGRRDPHSVLQHPASPGWSGVSTDDDDCDDGASLAVQAEYIDASEPGLDGVSKQPGYPYSMKPSALQYTRRPSGTNNHSTVPHVHRRMSSTSSSGHVRGIPRSAPHLSHSSTEDDDAFSDLGLSSRDNVDTEESDVPSEKGSDGGKVRLDADKAKRSRNRASLPAYFSLLQLQISSPANEPRSSPVSSSSGRTVARPSPPTPRVALSSRPGQFIGGHPPASIHATPRGRRRVPCESSTHRSDSSFSRSRSRVQQPAPEIMPRLVEKDLRSSVPGEPTRGRTTVRRNSSPPPNVLLGMEDRSRILAAVRQAEIFDRSQSRGERRGRAQNSELDGVGYSDQAPGFGNGRSGLVGRERDRERERSLGFVSRVPL